MKEKALELIKKYGKDFEKQKILEEMNELSSEIFRDINHREINRMKILEERVDVEFMLNMIDEIYFFSEKDKEKMWEIKKNKINSNYLGEKNGKNNKI